ncbi:MAG: hypothetical protein ACLTZT_08240 [Butyricimonas faecalis]
MRFVRSTSWQKLLIGWVPEVHHWRLNERHYGALQGLNKAETVKKYEKNRCMYGEGVLTTPPLLEPDDSRCAIFEDKYREVDPAVLPLGESLALTITRFSCFTGLYSTFVAFGKNGLGNSPRE